MWRHCASITGVLMLAVSVPVLASTERPLGMITQATAANLRTTPASPGTTLYDGDALSTAAGGQLSMRSGSATIYLAAQSSVTLHRISPDSTPDRIQASLTSGSGVFSTAQSSVLEINVDQARITPAKDQLTTAQVTIVGPKELTVFARRGSLEFTYRGQSELMQEGKAYRAILDPPDAKQTSSKGQAIKPPGRPRKAFLLILISVPSFLMPLAIYRALESPDRP